MVICVDTHQLALFTLIALTGFLEENTFFWQAFCISLERKKMAKKHGKMEWDTFHNGWCISQIILSATKHLSNSLLVMGMYLSPFVDSKNNFSGMTYCAHSGVFLYGTGIFEILCN